MDTPFPILDDSQYAQETRPVTNRQKKVTKEPFYFKDLVFPDN